MPALFCLLRGMTVLLRIILCPNDTKLDPVTRRQKYLLSIGTLLVIVWAFQYANIPKSPSSPEISQGSEDNMHPRESCLGCHSGMVGFTASHNPEEIGCVACHLGNPIPEGKSASHEGMIVIPGNLSDAAVTCSASGCHPGIDTRVKYSLMNTMSGVVAVNKYVFGEIDTLDGQYDIKALGSSAADTHLRNLCASCHLGNEKIEAGPVCETTRGGGCNACHLNYNSAAQNAHELYHRYGKKILPKAHPSLSLQVTNDHCFGCHSRSGRLSTNYEGWHETQLKPSDAVGKKSLRVLEDERVFTYIQDDVHHAKGLDCIDCHSSLDVMGYGVFEHQEDAVLANCRDCHNQEMPATATFDQLPDESKRIVKLRGIDPSHRFVVSQKSKLPLVNVFFNSKNQRVMRGKNSGKSYVLTSPGSKCTDGGAHSDITCSACHTKWAPQCISCHTSYDPTQESYDLLSNQEVMGSWQETGSHFLAEYPALGVVQKKGKRTIRTFIPGMIMTLDQSEFSGKNDDVSYHRLYAPTSPHTIAAKGQGCMDCHNNPVVLGYGRGELRYGKQERQWSFKPQFPLWKEDQLPLDAWIGFLQKAPKKKNATRTHARSFTLAEQQKILRVGACLTCHEEDSQVVRDMLQDFGNAIKRESDQCRDPHDP